MAVSVFKTFIAGEVLTAADLNSSLTQITGNGEDLAWPATKAKDLDGQDLVLDSDGDSTLDASTDDIAVFTLRGQELFKFDGATNGTTVNGASFIASATTADVVLVTQGSDTNIDLDIQGKGSGTVLINSVDPITTAFITSGTFADARISESSVTQHEAALTVTLTQSQISGLQDYELLDTQTPSGASSADFTSSISSTYASYDFVIEYVTLSASNSRLWIRTDTAGGGSFDTGATDYEYGVSSVHSSVTEVLNTSAGLNAIELNPADGGNGTREGVSGVVTLTTLGNTSPAHGARFVWSLTYFDTSGGVCFATSGGGERSSNTTIDAVQFLAETGNITGTIRMYGRRAA